MNYIRNQTYRNVEIIIVDDRSTDDTAPVAQALVREDPRITYQRLEEDDPDRIDPSTGRNVNAGYSARNHGLALARGELITFQDGDDASLVNRLEVQYALLTRYGAAHVVTGWRPFAEGLVGTEGPGAPDAPTLGPEELYALSQQTKGLVAKLFPTLNRAIPFRHKRWRFVHKLFFGSLAPYPGAGNSPLFRRDVAEYVRFRKLREREWPSFMGRGADRDFNFHVAERFRNSYFFDIPLYLWRT